MIDLTIIIPTLNHTDNPDRMRNIERARQDCLLSLEESVPDVPIILVSNGGEPEPISYVPSKQIKRIHLWEQNQGMAVNVGVSVTNTEWVFVSNDDMVYSPQWLEKLIDGLPPSVMCLSPKLIEPRQGAPTFGVYFCGGAGGDFDKQKWLEFASNYKGIGYITGFNLPFLIKRELWNLIEGYDILYGEWGSNSDSDLQAKIHLTGVQPYQNTDCIVYHFSGTSGTGSSENHVYWQKNWDYFIFKWGFERQSAPMVWFSKDIINKQKLIYNPSWKEKYGEIK